MTEQTFESALARLNEIITLLEKNEVTLSQAATLYQEGQSLLQFAQLQLNQFESMIDTKGE
ncbi:MAG: exodeoxyribonuclease VII small subunit [Erysipelothrix sp.]|jgi:exodeoxyribonuclease VII small subunit|nr:exodeoxyribonuclease VII small subunit [Erysipelothrix sp.]